MFEFSQPIQLRFNELLAGTRGDLAVKVFGEEFEPMTKVANQIAALLRGTQGAEDVKVEQTAGLPFLEIKIDKVEASRWVSASEPSRRSSARPSVGARPAWCSRATGAFLSSSA